MDLDGKFIGMASINKALNDALILRSANEEVAASFAIFSLIISLTLSKSSLIWQANCIAKHKLLISIEFLKQLLF